MNVMREQTIVIQMLPAQTMVNLILVHAKLVTVVMAQVVQVFFPIIYVWRPYKLTMLEH